MIAMIETLSEKDEEMHIIVKKRNLTQIFNPNVTA